MRDRISEVIKRYKHLCDYMEIRIEDFETTRISMKNRETEILDKSDKLGGCVRALIKGGWGFTSFNDIDLLDDFARRAVEQAKIVARGESHFAPVEVIEDEVPLSLISDPRGMSFGDKKKLLDRYNDIILNYNRSIIRNSSVEYYEQFKKKYFCNSDETSIYQEFMDLYITLNIMATKNDITQKLYVKNASTNDFNICHGLEEEIEKTCERVIKYIDSPKIRGGNYTVILDPIAAGVLAHESFGHFCEGDNFARDESLRKEMELGKVFGNKILNIYDSGLEVGSRGYSKYDDEGVRTEKTYLIKDGILSGRLNSRETAALLREKTTGSARALDYRYGPICRMRITCIDNGESTFSDMIKDVKLGIYSLGCTHGKGGETFTIVPAYSYMIRDGEIAEMVRGVEVKGNIFGTLKHIDMICNDLRLDNSGGGCGKGGQAPLPVADGGPHIRIQNVSIGGEIDG